MSPIEKDMQSHLAFKMLLALSCTSMHPLAHSAVQPFLAPPKLTEKSPAGPPQRESHLTMQVQPGIGTICNPSGDISRDGHDIRLTLPVEMRPNKIYNPATGDMDQVSLRSYGGCLSGPLIEARPGDTMRINLVNNLDKNDPSCPGGVDPKDGSAGCFNTINLHMHGMHVSPSGNSDNVLLNIAPQTRFEYEINIPSDHPSGTFWYHAHRHGSTAIQVASGASGVLVVRGNRRYIGVAPGDIDTILHDAKGINFAEQVFLFQQIPYACFTQQGNITWTCAKGMTGKVQDFDKQLSSPTVWDLSGRFTSINGVVQPILQNIAAGEIQRWRFIHAGIHDTINLQIVPMNTNSPKAKLLLKGMHIGTPREQASAIAEACPAPPPNDQPTSLVPQFEIAADGLTRSAIRPIGVKQLSVSGGVGSNYLQPGYRSDVLLVFPSAGTYCMLNQAATPDERVKPNHGGGQGPNSAQLLATVIVSGGTSVSTDLQSYIQHTLFEGNKGEKTLPANALKGLLAGDLSPWRAMSDLPGNDVNKDKQKAAFYIGNVPATPTGNFGFYLNDKSYDPNRIDFKRQVGSVDEWVLTSTGEPHIFHIHVNPFQVMDVLYAPPGKPAKSIFGPKGECLVPPDSIGIQNQYCGMWHAFKDTVFVQNDYQVLVRTRYDRYIGEFVIHCHILDHEDGGMMANIQIIPDSTAPGGGIGMVGMKHAVRAGSH